MYKKLIALIGGKLKQIPRKKTGIPLKNELRLYTGSLKRWKSEAKMHTKKC